MVNLKYFAIVGVGRSGTTLLMSMLNAHPEIVLPPEFHFIEEFVVQYPSNSFHSVMSKIKSNNRFSRLGLSPEEIAKYIKNMNRPSSLISFYFSTLELYLNQAWWIYYW